MKHLVCGSLLALVLFALHPAAHAAEGYANCAGYIDSVPASITTQGVWCLRKDLNFTMGSGDAITVGTNNVTIDCNDFKIGGLKAGATAETVGIRATNRLNTTVRNCLVRGFKRGVFLDGLAGGGHVVEDNHFDGNLYIAIHVLGDGSVVRRNLVSDTGGSTSEAHAIGILGGGQMDVLDNTIGSVRTAEEGAGIATAIMVSLNEGGSISDNRISGLVGGTTGGVRGIRALPGRLALRNNDLIDYAPGSAVAFMCDSTDARLKDNMINGYYTANSGCGDAGGNTSPP
jgi:hypothetical protein